MQSEDRVGKNALEVGKLIKQVTSGTFAKKHQLAEGEWTCKLSHAVEAPLPHFEPTADICVSSEACVHPLPQIGAVLSLSRNSRVLSTEEAFALILGRALGISEQEEELQTNVELAHMLGTEMKCGCRGDHV